MPPALLIAPAGPGAVGELFFFSGIIREEKMGFASKTLLWNCSQARFVRGRQPPRNRQGESQK